MFKQFLKPQVKTALAIVWFVFTFSLVAWWWIFFLIKMDPAEIQSLEQMQKTHRMFSWEGSILLAAILLGGSALVFFTYRDQARHQRLRLFFSTFSHDIKTSITRLRLQAEILEEESSGAASPVIKRLVHDIQRLDLQLENSLFLANLDQQSLLLEEISLRDLFSGLRNEFPELSIEIERDAKISGDRRALTSVFKNSLQNSVMHGKASLLRIRVQVLSGSRIEVILEDNGLGFRGDIKKLGSEILTSTHEKSNGLGLLITKRLVEKMRGGIRYSSLPNSGFSVVIELNGVLK
jgi:signal transduction histidine kinase